MKSNFGDFVSESERYLKIAKGISGRIVSRLKHRPDLIVLRPLEPMGQ